MPCKAEEQVGRRASSETCHIGGVGGDTGTYAARRMWQLLLSHCKGPVFFEKRPPCPSPNDLQERKDGILRLIKIIARPVLYPFFQIKTAGVENLPKNGAFVLLPKHQRWEDIPLLGLATPRPLYYIAKSELFRKPLLRWFLSSLGGIPLNRKRPIESRRTLRTMIHVLKKDGAVVIFPEGTYFRERVGPGNGGLIRLVRSHAAIPFIPVGIRYSGEKIRRIVKITYGDPIYENAYKKNDAFLFNIMKEIARLSGF